jgi:hypothetical protein
MESDKFLEKIFGRNPGLDLVVAAITGFTVPVIIGKNLMEDWGLIIVPAVWTGSLILSHMSRKLDEWVFDPLYGTQKTRNTKYAQIYRFLSRILFLVTYLVDSSSKTITLDEKRREAVLRLKRRPLDGVLEVGEDEGIYASAKKIFEGREEWEDRIKSRLEYSKAARVFIFPLLFIIGWEVLHSIGSWPPYVIPVKTEHDIVRWIVLAFQCPVVVYLVLQVFAFVYLYLRIGHMSNLYDLVIEAKVFSFEVNSLDHGTINREMLRVGSVIVPTKELLIFKER